MGALTLTKTRIQGGVWEGVLTVPPERETLPRIEVTHLDAALPLPELVEDPERDHTFHLRIPIPAETLADGVQTFLICDGESGEKLGSFAVVTGEPLEDELGAEVALLRAELDMLKRAFRRHCIETAGS